MTKSANDHAFIPDIKLELYLLGELSRDEQQALALCIAGDAQLRNRIDALRSSNDDVLKTYPSAHIAKGIEQRLRSNARPARIDTTWSRHARAIVAGPALVLLALVAIGPLLFPLVDSRSFTPTTAPQEVIIEKGTPSVPRLWVYKKTGAQSVRMEDNNEARARDLVQLSYAASGRRHGVILSIDGNAHVALHFPRDTQSGTQLARGAEIPLPYAYELDDAPQFERFVFLTSNTALDVEQILTQARLVAADPDRARSAALPTGKDVDQYSVVIKKGNP
jgi:hypothetical protein